MNFKEKENILRQRHEELLARKNEPLSFGRSDLGTLAYGENGIYERYRHPILTAEHTPLEWRYDFSEQDNPYLMQRIMMNAVLNAGAIKLDGRYLLVCRVEGADRKSFFAVAESPNGVDNFRFWDEPVTMPSLNSLTHDSLSHTSLTPDPSPKERGVYTSAVGVSADKGNHAPLPGRGVGGEAGGAIGASETNVYDMRLTQHEDGWIYGVFCAERHDDTRPGDLSAATASAAIARTKDLKTWERLPDLQSKSQQRNVVLHPEFVDGRSAEGRLQGKKYAFYTRPQDGFIDTGSGGGIGWGLCEDITHAVIEEEIIINPRHYHTIMEVKNGEGPAPLKTPQGWLHLAHGVRATASGLRYVLYMYMTALDDPTRVIAQPGGYFLAPEGDEYVGDVMNVAFSNGWIKDDDGRVLIYYATADTRLHVATSTVERLVDYCLHTPQDGLTTAASVETIKELIRKNKKRTLPPAPPL